MTNLIIGCGYLGSRVGKAWADMGIRVGGLTRGRAQTLRTLGIEPYVGDIFDPQSLKNLPAASTLFYAMSHDRRAGRSFREVYVDGLQNVLRAIPRPERIVYISSTSVYGQSAGEWVTEESATEPADANGRIILEAEQALRAHDPDAIILRFAGIYGPGRVLRRAAIEKGEPIVGDADRWLNLIHVDDGASIAVLASEKASAGRTYLVCDGQPVKRRDFYNYLAQLLQVPAPSFESLPPGSPPAPHESGNRRVSNQRIRAELGVAFRFPDFRTGLKQAMGASDI